MAAVKTTSHRREPVKTGRYRWDETSPRPTIMQAFGPRGPDEPRCQKCLSLLDNWEARYDDKAVFCRLGAVEIHRELMTAEHSRIIAAKL
jgi:hypothetical protein